MESGALVSSEKEGQQGASYTYWVRKITEDAAPLPVPRKLNPEDVPPCHSQSQSRSATLGSAWNRAGTWEEKSLNNWATPRIKELLISLGSIQFSFGRAEVEDVTKCVGDCVWPLFIPLPVPVVSSLTPLPVSVLRLTLYNWDVGEWIIQGEKKFVGGHIDVPEFSFGELDELQHWVCGCSLILGMDSLLVALLLTRKVVEVRLSEARDILHQDKTQICNDLKLFLQPVREKLLQFEQELKDR
ncbi:hypothetical protein JHK87_000008 [Glycine soja]|nr:hypothetical protein JHK87_000008 [Glycine soja]